MTILHSIIRAKNDVQNPGISEIAFNASYSLEIQGPPKKCIHTLTKENSKLYKRLLEIYNIFPSTQ